MDILWLDFETFGTVDLGKCGAVNYAKDSDLEILTAQYALNFDPPTLIDNTEEGASLSPLADILNRDDIVLGAFNAPFELLILEHSLNFIFPLNRVLDLMAHSYRFSFFGGLGDVGEQMGIGNDKAKLKSGKKLIDKFCKPAPKNHKATRYDKSTHPKKWGEFLAYAKNDITAMQEAWRALKGYKTSKFEKDLWVIDRKINAAGLPIDKRLVESAMVVDKQNRDFLYNQLKDLTKLDNPNSTVQLMQWFNSKGIEIDNLQADTVQSECKKYRAFKGEDTPLGEIYEALSLRANLAKTATKKYYTLYPCLTKSETGHDILEDTLQYAGAQRTNRWAGRKFQSHNLATPKWDFDEEEPELLYQNDRSIIEAIYEDPTAFLSSCVRSVVCATEGHKLVVRDLSAIESRLVGWVCMSKDINTVFALGLDLYKDFGSNLFQVPYEAVTPKQRKLAKPAVLGCGYGLGRIGLARYSENFGIELDEATAKIHVDTFREKYHEVPECWYWLVDSCMDTILNGSTHEGYWVTISRDVNFLKISLPSGRTMYYYAPEVRSKVPPWGGAPRPNVTYMGKDQKTFKWARVFTHGGKILENIIQAIARDIQAEAIYNIFNRGWDVRLHVHDEIVLNVVEEKTKEAYEDLGDVYNTSPVWAPGLILDSSGYTAKRYRKD